MLSLKQEELKLKEKELQARQNSQTPVRQHQIGERWNSDVSQFSQLPPHQLPVQTGQTQPSQLLPPKRPNIAGANKRTELFLQLRKENEELKAKLNSISNRAADNESLAEQIVEVHSRLSGFCQRVTGLLNQTERSGQFSNDSNLKAAVGELTNRLRRYKQENE